MNNSFTRHSSPKLIIGTLLLLIFFSIDLMLSYRQGITVGQEQSRRFNMLMADHTAHNLVAVDTLLQAISNRAVTPIAGDMNWKDSDNAILLGKFLAQPLPQIRDVLVYDAQGQLAGATSQNHRKDIHLQEDFIHLSRGQLRRQSGPLLEDEGKQYVYTLSHRLGDTGKPFAGIVQAIIAPHFLQDFCWQNRLSEETETVLTNQKNEIIASCRPSNHGPLSSLIGHHSEEALFQGKLVGLLGSAGTGTAKNFIISRQNIPNFPELYMLTVTPARSLVPLWPYRFYATTLLAFVTIVFGLFAARTVHKRFRDQEQINRNLKISHDALEKQIAATLDELAQQRDQAELANVAKSRFLAAASHDLRQPMHALALFTTDLRAQVRQGIYRDLPRLSEQIRASTRQLSSLLDALLDISRLDVSGIKPNRRPTPLQPVFERLFTAHRRAASDKKQVLRFRSTPLWLETDPDLLERMLGNLVSNAIRYTPAGGRILIAARGRGKEVLIEVRDNGIGIAPENQAAVFTEFFQVDNAAREQKKGIGLGLSIVDRLARTLHIKIGLQSALNRGTVFSLTVQGCDNPKISESGRSILPTILLAGARHELQEVEGLLDAWGYSVLFQETSPISCDGLPEQSIIIASARMLCETKPFDTFHYPVIALMPTEPLQMRAIELPGTVYQQLTPLRPARLRALLTQLQNTSSKSIP